MTRSANDLMQERGGTAGLTTGDCHELLSSRYCRLALVCLAEQSAAMDLGELTDRVAMRADDVDADDGEAVERIAIGLHHVHLPKMDDAGVVDYYPESHLIEPTAILVE